METYYPYNPDSEKRISETCLIEDGKVQLRHIPKENSIQIDGFTETTSINILASQFRCNYSLETAYRESNRIIYFNPANNDREVSISYIAVGTPFTAADANEIKAHMENASIHGGGGGSDFQIGDGFYRSPEFLVGEFGLDFPDQPYLNSRAYFQHVRLIISWSIYEAAQETMEFAIEDIEDEFVRFAGRASRSGDIIKFHPEPSSGGSNDGFAIRVDGKWIILSSNAPYWDEIVPFFTVKDRERLDGNGNLILGTTPSTVEGAMWINVPQSQGGNNNG